MAILTRTKNYEYWELIDRICSDEARVFLHCKGTRYRCEESWDGTVLEVESQVMERKTQEMMNIFPDPLIDIVQSNMLSKVGPLSPDEVRKTMKAYEERLIQLMEESDSEKVEKLRKKIQKFTDFVVENLDNIHMYVGLEARIRHKEGSPIFAYYKDGYSPSSSPTIMYLAYGLEPRQVIPYWESKAFRQLYGGDDGDESFEEDI